ncbi:Gfo/Idh/MocA family oxidoreductase [Vibrio sp. TH_r3]|uniref:Gfo/Idh/MocA family protein n=1 Tax=Vibrio sp. TH_r3 TaxID=3082084 RepID=UPI002952A390|nr:Gfo/Idh/MocA family oxidoreductase [Vibrio sp. TH_r3]MDV7106280.1 Gfo/Idh/MocA family oxidoreductase [Vibrio sp. TH_r3]
MQNRTVNIGIVGIGMMGSEHAASLKMIPEANLTAICGLRKNKADQFANKFDAKPYYDVDEMINSGDIDAIIIATPHYDHPSIAIKALAAGLHVLTEKPIAVHKADGLKMIAAHREHRNLRFAAMFNQRTIPAHQKIKQLIDDGELGEIRRINWIITDWFRTQQYYDSCDWRGTWKGEGGGVLLNQCVHQLDLFQWFFGLPTKVRSFSQIGKYHNIEVEDDITTYCEFENGATGVFIASTGEAPGTNRLEVSGELGRLVFENNQLLFTRNMQSMSEFSREAEQGFAKPEAQDIIIPLGEQKIQEHQAILQNFCQCILDENAQLIAPAEEGIKSLELANSMTFSFLTDTSVEMPLDEVAYQNLLQDQINRSNS